jgi:hypothetical protein
MGQYTTVAWRQAWVVRSEEEEEAPNGTKVQGRRNIAVVWDVKSCTLMYK